MTQVFQHPENSCVSLEHVMSIDFGFTNKFYSVDECSNMELAMNQEEALHSVCLSFVTFHHLSNAVVSEQYGQKSRTHITIWNSSASLAYLVK